MPSQALTDWMTVRLMRLNEFDHQISNNVPPLSLTLQDGNLRAYVMLLSADFQGFCRDLYSECTQKFATALTPELATVMQFQCSANRLLEKTNPSYKAIKSDFGRFGIIVANALAPDQMTKANNDRRKTHLERLGLWRNYCAHHNPAEPQKAGVFSLAAVREWKVSCAEFAAELDRIMGDFIKAQTKVQPWE